MSLLYDSHDSRVQREHGAASEAGLNGLQHPGSQGNVETFKLMSFFQPLPHIHYLPLPISHRFICYTSRYAFAWTCLDLEVYPASRLFVSIKKTTWIHEVPKGGEQASGLVLCRFSFFLYLFLYLCILSECHSNGRMSICMTTGLRSREGAPGRDSIHKQELVPPPPHIAIFFIRTNKRIHSPAHPTTLCAKYDNKERRAGCLYCYFSRIKQ